MIQKLTYLESEQTSPYYNLAVEKQLCFHCKEGECILYLWQNQNTVVVGRNQNIWKECRVELLEKEGGFLARRSSGGGAVYQDLGNLNFTFFARKNCYDEERQTQVILRAVSKLGVCANKSGRNDLIAWGKKFSGHAYFVCGDCCYHHGTLMVSVDLDRLSKYLTVSKEKLQLKGIDSVRARVENLSEFVPDLTISTLKEKLLEAFEELYVLKAGHSDTGVLDQEELAKEKERFAAKSWIFNASF